MKARVVALAVISWILLGGDRAALRIPFASSDFPVEHAGFIVQQPLPATVEVAAPIDVRASHYDEPVAGTDWTGCATDAIWKGDVSTLLQSRIADEIAYSNLFLPADSAPPGARELVLTTKIDAFCSRVRGFIFGQGAGIVSLEFTLLDGDKPVWQKKIEHVVTDSDPDYSGSQVTFIEQAMRILMMDSLKLVLRDMLQDIDRTYRPVLEPARQQ